MLWVCMQIVGILAAHFMGLIFAMGAGSVTKEKGAPVGKAGILFFISCVFHCIGSVVAMGLEVGP